MRRLELDKAFTVLEPGPVVLVTTRERERYNVMTISWTTVLDITPRFGLTALPGTLVGAPCTPSVTGASWSTVARSIGAGRWPRSCRRGRSVERAGQKRPTVRDPRRADTLAMRVRSGLLLAFALAGTARAAAPTEPPPTLTDDGACPFECCTYRDWSVEADTELLEAAQDGARVVGRALQGTRVLGLTGKVIVTAPGQIRVRRDFTGESGTRYAAGDVLWVYTEAGEGFFRMWYRGRFYDEEASFMYQDRGGWDSCVRDDTCWGERIRFPVSVWWVKVRTPDGVTGWTRSPEHFGDKDACG